MIAQAAIHLLHSSDAINAIVGQRTHYTQRPQGDALPALLIQSWATRHDHHQKGVGEGASYGILRVTALARTYTTAADLAALVRNRLDGRTGPHDIADPEGNAATIDIEWLLIDDEAELPTDHRDGQGQPLTHGRQTDFRYAIKGTEPTHA